MDQAHQTRMPYLGYSMQRSILGPLLFLVYIDDILPTSDGSHSVPYADDLLLSESVVNLPLQHFTSVFVFVFVSL